MRIRILKKVDVTVVVTSNDSGKISVEEFTKILQVGKMMGGFFDIAQDGDTADLHHVNGSVFIDVPIDAIEIHGDKPTTMSSSSGTCCKERS